MYKLLKGHVIDQLKKIPDKSVHCVITSPPYFRQRDYGLPSTIWKDSWEGQLGLEPTPELFVQHLADVFDEVSRVLRDDGILWINLGDSYYNSSAGNKFPSGFSQTRPSRSNGVGRIDKKPINDMKKGNLIGVPWMFAFEMRKRGWIIRSEIIFAKGVSFCETYSGSCLPESVQSRPSRSHEHIFMFTKNTDYYYDIDAVREKQVGVQKRPDWLRKRHVQNVDGTKHDGMINYGKGLMKRWLENPTKFLQGRNLRSVWTISQQARRNIQHTATMPDKIPETCIKASTSERGVCASCLTQYERIIEEGSPDEDWKTLVGADKNGEYKGKRQKEMKDGSQNSSDVKRRIIEGMNTKHTVGWKKSCKCQTEEIVPAVVLDPFNGSGTSGVIALKLGRQYIGIELNEEYVKMSEERLVNVKTVKTLDDFDVSTKDL